MIATALVGIAAAMLLVRLGWGGRRAVAAAGWALAIGGGAVLTVLAGAWGLAVGAIAGMATALAMVLEAGWRAPRKEVRAPRTPASITLPRRPRDLLRRLGVFVLVVPVGFVATQWLAYCAQAAVRRFGTGEADAIVMTLFLQPILWGMLMAWQMTRAGPARMIAAPAGAAAIGVALWSIS